MNMLSIIINFLDLKDLINFSKILGNSNPDYIRYRWFFLLKSISFKIKALE